MNWRREYELEKGRKDHLQTRVTDLENERREYRWALEDLAKRLGVHANYVHEFTRNKYERIPHNPLGIGIWVPETYTGFDTDLFVEDLAEIRRGTGAEERLTPTKTKKEKESK